MSSRSLNSAVETLDRKLETPMPMQILRHGRYLFGFAVAAGAFALLSHGDVAAADEYTVQKGDTLSYIAGARGVSVSSLAAANGLSDQHAIVAGKKLTLPASGSGSAKASVKTSATSTGSSTSTSSGATYTVKKGDTLSAIAGARGVSVSSLAAANGLSDQHAIVAGKKLTLPASGSASTKSSTKAKSVNGLPAELSNSSRKSLQKQFNSASKAYGIPGDLLQAVAYHESGWNNSKVSSVGAQGIGQVMPDTADFVNEYLVSTKLDPSVPEHNIKMSAAYMRYLLDQTGGDTSTALAAYYQGLGAVQTKGVYAETHQYVRSVRALQNSYFN